MVRTRKKVQWERSEPGLLGDIKDVKSIWLELAIRAPLLSEGELDASVDKVVKVAKAIDSVWAPFESLLELAAEYEDDSSLRRSLYDLIERYAVQANLIEDDSGEGGGADGPSERAQIIARAVLENARIKTNLNISILTNSWVLITRPMDNDRAVSAAEGSYFEIQACIQEFPNDRRLWEIFDSSNTMMLEIWAHLIKNEPEAAQSNKIISKFDEAKDLYWRLFKTRDIASTPHASIVADQTNTRYNRTPGGEVGVRENISSNDQLLDALKERGVSDDLRRQVAAALTVGGRLRPRWDDRAKFQELAHLSAPRFLKTVYADLLDADGNLVDEEAVRLSDPRLVQIVQTYINKRHDRSQPLGDAKGLVFRNRDGRGRPKKPKVQKRRSRALSPSG